MQKCHRNEKNIKQENCFCNTEQIIRERERGNGMHGLGDEGKKLANKTYTGPSYVLFL